MSLRGFKLGGGRQMEIPDVVFEPLDKADTDPNLQKSDCDVPTADNKPKKSGSQFRNFL